MDNLTGFAWMANPVLPGEYLPYQLGRGALPVFRLGRERV